jgi:hypothetical protein
MNGMQPETPLLPEEDQPLDAIVVEEVGYPFAIRPEDIYRPTPLFKFQSPAPAQYVVPKRFGMSAIFGIMTGLAVLFGFFRAYDAPPVMYLFFGVQAIVICLAQMFYGKTPRVASTVAGGILLPTFMAVGASLFNHRGGIDDVACTVIGSVPVGAFLGYLTGTLAAGVFLVMDAFEKSLLRLWGSNLPRHP